MTPEEPTLSTAIIHWIVNAVFAIALLIGRVTYSRSIQRQDDAEKRNIEKQNEVEARLRTLEKESVTHADLRRLEDKLDVHYNQITERLNRILERSSK